MRIIITVSGSVSGFIETGLGSGPISGGISTLRVSIVNLF